MKNISQDEFVPIYQELAGSYPEVDDPPNRMKATFRVVRDYSKEVFEEAVKECLVTYDRFLPTPGEIYEICERIAESKIKRPNPSLISKFSPVPHKCADLTGKVQTSAWRLVNAIKPIEAKHLWCPSTKTVCLRCGKRYGPVVSRFIEVMMKLNPEETKGWNPIARAMTCEQCSKKEVAA